MNRIKQLREDLNLTQADIASAINIDQKSLSNYETEKTYPDSNILIALADYFEVSIDYLVGRTNVQSFTNHQIVGEVNQLISQLEDLKKKWL